MKRTCSAAAFALFGMLAASPALAHPGHGDVTLAAGLLHPLTGLDHILAMVAVGLMAARRGGPAMLAWPLTFVTAMLAGYALGRVAPGALFIEPAILASVIALGALTASSVQMSFVIGLGLIAAFGLCHGYAHGSEAPAGAGIGFPVGFAVSTALLHGAGLAMGAAALCSRRSWLVRAAGVGVALGGLVLALAG
jgi:urease accessory protein